MIRFVKLGVFIVACGILWHSFLADAEAASASDYREIRWEDLVPEDWHPEKVFEGIDFNNLPEDDSDRRVEEAYAIVMKEWANAPANEKLQGQRIKIPGFIAPLDWKMEGELKEFLLVPYFGACIHFPPPPSNQVIYVKMDKPLKGVKTMAPIWVYGTISLEKNDSGSMGTSGYSMQIDKVEPYQE